MTEYEWVELSKMQPVAVCIPEDSFNHFQEKYKQGIDDPEKEPISLIKLQEALDDKLYIIQNRDKRATALNSLEIKKWPARIQLYDEDDDDHVAYLELAKKAREAGIKSLDDLQNNIVPREDYERITSSPFEEALGRKLG